MTILETQAKKEVDLFIMAIEMNPAVVSLGGYLEVNRELLTSVIICKIIYLTFKFFFFSVYFEDCYLFAGFDSIQVFFGKKLSFDKC